MEVHEDDETFQTPVDQMFEALKKKKPNHFAVRQYAKFKLAAGVVCSKRPVSYTHLDVYKRQEEGNPAPVWFIRKCPSF